MKTAWPIRQHPTTDLAQVEFLLNPGAALPGQIDDAEYTTCAGSTARSPSAAGYANSAPVRVQ